MDESSQPQPTSMDRMAFQIFNSWSTLGNFALLDYGKW
jgi:hypothetical protein